MSDLLSQEELDALLRSGIGNYSTDEEPAEDLGPAQFTPFASSRHTQDPGKKPLKLKRSSKVDLEQEEVVVQKAVFEDFGEDEMPGETTNLEIILNLNLEIRVQLGKTTSTVKEVLEMGQGSVLELDKLNGEPVDLFVNERPFSKGEMIVIGENFGVRVTDILTVPEIIEALGK